MPNKRGEDVVEAMTNGGDVTEITDPNGQLGGALATLSSGSSTPDILNNQIVFLENRILKYAMLSTDLVMGKAAQQSVSETSKVDRQVLEHLIKLNALRKYNYQRFFDALGKMVGVEIGVELPLPFVDQYQIDSLKANLKVLEGQAVSQMATAQQAPATEEVPVEGE